MQDNPLQQLRDVHAPLAPEWWPPAPGWWLLAIAIVATLFFIGRLLWRAHKARRPVRSAQAMIKALRDSHDQGRIDSLQYINESNEVLKRLLVNALGIRHLGATSDEQWLNALDTISNSREFSVGCGKIFGTQRFSPRASAEVEAVDRLLQKLLTRVHPTRTPLLLAESSND